MPIVDRRSKSLVLRVVYDGPPAAGKATNLRQLCGRLSLRQRGALADPADPDRTPFFDWLDVTDGWVGGHRVRCQLAAVPGQIELARRRRHILDSADVVVFVADARPGAAPETSAALRSLARGLTSRDVPLVLQANKQDLPDAQLPEPLRDALGLATRVPVIGAEAAGGRGVLETFQLATRLAADHVRALLVDGEPGSLGTAALLRALESDAPDALDALDAVARAAARRTTPPVLRAVPAPAPATSGDATSERAEKSANDEPTRPIRVIRCVPVRTTTTAEARAMIGAAMQASVPIPRTGKTAPPLNGTRIGSFGRNGKPTAPPIADPEPVNAADSEAATRPIRMNRFTPAKAIMTVPGGAAVASRSTGPIAIPILAAPSAPTPPSGTMPMPVIGSHGTPREPLPIPVLIETVAEPPLTEPPPETPVRPSDADTLVAVVAVEAHAIEAITIEPIAIEAITIEREAVAPGPLTAVLVASALAEPFLGTDDDPTWELPAVDPSPPVAAGALHESTIREAIARQDEPTAPIELAAPESPSAAAESPSAAADPPPAAAESPPAAAESPSAAAATDSPSAATDPPYHLPPVDLPAGLVWPGVCGRAALVAIAAPSRRIHPPTPWAPAHAIELACGEGWIAHTSDELVYPDLLRGETALFEAVRWHAKLAAFAPPERTYAVSPEPDHIRLWVLTPAQRTLWTAIEDAFARGDRREAGRLARLGLAVVDELREQDISITDLDHITVDEPLRLLVTPWTPHSDRLIVQLQHLFAAAVL